MKAWALGSGSRGNAILLECGGTRVLIDAGFAPRALARRLATVHVPPESIEAVVVTHEHVDHSRGVAAAQAKWGWRVVGSAGTLAGIGGLDARRTIAVAPARAFAIGALDVELVRVPHDAAEPTAVLATVRRSGFRAGCAHDLGSVSGALRRAFTGLDLLLLESNHDEALLRSGPYPPFLQDRIASRTGHLSNRQSSGLARELAGPSLRALVLLHLSEVNNTPEHATHAATMSLAGTRVRGVAVAAAAQDRVVGPFGDARGGARQLRLAL
ncbi:MAG TPA: MBL fold metallo-hydrolase [Gemmatimonadaceae bacterium]|nr:MBL fold metallo-hydrolase [Gemmatimonadaceae bacterium]